MHMTPGRSLTENIHAAHVTSAVMFTILRCGKACQKGVSNTASKGTALNRIRLHSTIATNRGVRRLHTYNQNQQHFRRSYRGVVIPPPSQPQRLRTSQSASHLVNAPAFGCLRNRCIAGLNAA